MKGLIKHILREGTDVSTKTNRLLVERENLGKLDRLFLILEKEIKVGDNLTKKLNKINTPLSKKILGFLNSNKIKDDANVEYVDYDKKNEKLITLGYKDRDGNTKERLLKINKLLNYLGSDIGDIKGYEVEELISHLQKADTSQLKLVDGEDILKAYHCDNYEDGETMGSCMRHDYAQEYLEIYTENPNEVKCLVLLNPETKKVRGRALIWHMDNDQQFMDRIYTINKEYEKYFHNYAEENNISRSAKSTVTLENGGEYDTYPYMDKFQYYQPSTGTLSADNESGDDWIVLQDTHGGHSEPGVYIEYGEHEGERVDEDEAFYISYRTPYEYKEGWAHQEDLTVIDSEVYLLDDCVKTYDYEWVYKYDEDTFIVELTHGRYKGEYAKHDDAIQLEHEYYGEDNFLTIDDNYVDLDSDIYEIPHALPEDTIEAYGGEYILKSDAIKLFTPHYGEDVYAHAQSMATKIELEGHGYVWVLETDVDDFEEGEIGNFKIVQQNTTVSENKRIIKNILRGNHQNKFV